VKQYSLGFLLFDGGEEDYVLLLKKNKPDSQKGRYNGIGGRAEPGETMEQCMAREAQEEAGIWIHPEEWNFIGTMRKEPTWEVFVYYAYVTTDEFRSVRDECDEGPFLWARLNALPSAVMNNLRWMLPFIKNHPIERQLSFHVLYESDGID